jgi:hypothetical protein
MAIRFWTEGVREFFAFDPGSGQEIIGHVDEGIKKQHASEYAAFKGPEVLSAPVEEVIAPEAEEEEEMPLITQTNNPTIEFKE